MAICGNFNSYTKRRPKNWGHTGYKMIVPFKFKWRATLGRAVCNCKTVKEHYQPWYGYTWYHSDECATIKHLNKYPQMENFFWDNDPRVIAMSD